MSPRIAESTVNSPDYWDARYRSGDYRTLDPTNNLPRFRRAAALQVGDSALDLGCGEMGLWTELPRHVRYVGVDYSSDALENALSTTSRFVCSDWRRAVLESATTVYLLDILEHEAEPVGLLAFGAALARRRLVVCVPRYRALGFEDHRGEHAWDWTDDEMRALLDPWGRVTGPSACNSLEVLWTVDR